MKLAEHVEHIRQLIDKAFRNRFGRMGITVQWAINNLQKALISDKLTDCQLAMANSDITNIKRIIDILNTFEKETGDITLAYEKLIEEFTFTLFNRLAAMKVMEAHTLYAEIVTRRNQYGDRSFAHFLWLEQNPDGRKDEQEGLIRFFEDQLTRLADDIPLFNPKHPYHLLPTAIELNGIINAFNKVESDPQIETEIWKSDDVLGWLYESYNNFKKTAHKESGEKTEYNKVSVQSQVYTPRWIVKFLVDNSLGKLYLEMYPDSVLKMKYKIANAPKTQSRERKPLNEIRLIDIAVGSGNFVLYGFDLFFDFYIDQIENYGADYNEKNIPELIIKHNLYGIDLDDRAVQLAQLGLYIKAKRRKRSAKIEHFNIVSSDFFLPDYKVVKHLFEDGEPLSPELERIVTDLWTDLQQAHKFGSLIRLEEKFSIRLHGLVQKFGKAQLQVFEESTLANYDNFKDTFFHNLQKAIFQNTATQGLTFINTKTQDAITFLHLLTQKYDVSVSNPPYTDSADFGKELKEFIEGNYRQPYKFNSNLYAAFIKRCYEIIDETGKIALIHPLTFMYIKSFEDVRKFIVKNLHINVFVDYGLSNLFGSVMVDPAFYVFEKEKTTKKAWFISLDQYTRTPQERFKKDYCLKSLTDFIENKPNKHNFTIDQAKIKIIEGYPFIYWISNGFREKFKEKSLDDVLNPRQGIATGNNDKCVRFWWEINNNDISVNVADKKKWKFYSKGGPYNKWFGNFWTVINYSPSGYEFLLNNGNHLPSRSFYFQSGATYSASGSKGTSFRLMPDNQLFDVGGSCIFLGEYSNLYYILAFLNSKLSYYIAECLNPTVNIQVGDLKRIPFVTPTKEQEEKAACLVSININIKKHLNSYKVIEFNFEKNPLNSFSELSLRDRITTYLAYENAQLTFVLINEAIINQLIFEIYALSSEDRAQVEMKMGSPVGELPVVNSARDAFLSLNTIDTEVVTEFIQTLPTGSFEDQEIQTIKTEFGSLYQSNNDLEEFCIRHKVNPINIWYWFNESKTLPQGRAAEIALEFLADTFRTILMEDDDGIIPLVGLPDELKLLDRLEEQCLKIGFTSAQFMQLDSLLGRPIKEYIEHHFFKNFSDQLNLFMYLPKTPFIWHLCSGEHQGFEAYIIIYKWNRDSLFKLKTLYLSKRVESLEFRQIELQDSISAQAQSEKERIRFQLQEIFIFSKKIEELISEGYDPKLDDGVGKNIAPLQKKGLLRCEVLNKKQLEKYLNADW
jgi:hypothetical protein